VAGNETVKPVIPLLQTCEHLSMHQRLEQAFFGFIGSDGVMLAFAYIDADEIVDGIKFGFLASKFMQGRGSRRASLAKSLIIGK
jgi:hypothetical protein